MWRMLPFVLKINKNEYMHIGICNISRKVYKKLFTEVPSENNWVAGGSG